MNFIHMIALCAILQYLFFGIQVGRARAKYGIQAPAMAGNEQFERAVRVHANTLEQLVVFLPALVIASSYWQNGITVIIGLVYLIGRFIYWRAYMAEPSTRATGFLLTIIPSGILILMGIIGAIFKA